MPVTHGTLRAARAAAIRAALRDLAADSDGRFMTRLLDRLDSIDAQFRQPAAAPAGDTAPATPAVRGRVTALNVTPSPTAQAAKQPPRRRAPKAATR